MSTIIYGKAKVMAGTTPVKGEDGKNTGGREFAELTAYVPKAKRQYPLLSVRMEGKRFGNEYGVGAILVRDRTTGTKRVQLVSVRTEVSKETGNEILSASANFVPSLPMDEEGQKWLASVMKEARQVTNEDLILT